MSIEKIEAQIKAIEKNIELGKCNKFAAANKIKNLIKEKQKAIEKDLHEKKLFEQQLLF